MEKEVMDQYNFRKNHIPVMEGYIERKNKEKEGKIATELEFFKSEKYKVILNKLINDVNKTERPVTLNFNSLTCCIGGYKVDEIFTGEHDERRWINYICKEIDMRASKNRKCHVHSCSFMDFWIQGKIYIY